MAKKSKTEPILFGPFPAGAVTAANYTKKATEFVRAGLGTLNVIRNWRAEKGETPERWCAWIAFLAQIGAADAVRFAEARGSYEVPAEWPWEFSADAAPIEGRLHNLIRAYARNKPEDPQRAPDAGIVDKAAISAARRAEQATEAWEREERRVAAAEALGDARRRADEEAQRNSFLAAGVEPPILAPGQIGMSLPLMLSLGWSIESDEHGVKRLVRVA